MCVFVPIVPLALCASVIFLTSDLLVLKHLVACHFWILAFCARRSKRGGVFAFVCLCMCVCVSVWVSGRCYLMTCYGNQRYYGKSNVMEYEIDRLDGIAEWKCLPYHLSDSCAKYSGYIVSILKISAEYVTDGPRYGDGYCLLVPIVCNFLYG